MDLILGLFFADENNIVYENVKLGQNLTEVSSPTQKLLPLKFFGPLFLSSASKKTSKWKINLVEGLMAEKDSNIDEFDVIQSFFILNSSILYEKSPTHLSVLIGSPYTEDIYNIYSKINDYIHPCILQNKIVMESFYPDKFEYEKFIKQELMRGINLIEFSLGSARKTHWHKEKKYFCVGIIERIKSKDKSSTYLYTFDVDSPIRQSILKKIPSYYLLSILPGYYENLIDETLYIFNIKNLQANIAKISLRNNGNEVLYMEEFKIDNFAKRNLGVILIAQEKENDDMHFVTFYKQQLRQILDIGKNFEKTIIKINKDINPFEKWKTDTSDNLKKIHDQLDSGTN
ncbi:MAG: hypothetical protein P8Y97_07310 [Candidatus Lokiarchaeota archaeon]